MNLNRRSMMLGAGGLAALAASPFAAQAARASGKIASIGLQLYTVRELFAADPVARCRGVTEMPCPKAMVMVLIFIQCRG